MFRLYLLLLFHLHLHILNIFKRQKTCSLPSLTLRFSVTGHTALDDVDGDASPGAFGKLYREVFRTTPTCRGVDVDG
jgi:hypothetical protein